MEELKYSKQELLAFRNLLCLYHIFIDDIEVLDKFLRSAYIIFNVMDFSNKKCDKGLEEIYDKTYYDAKEYYLNLIKQKNNETLSELRKSEV